ncbi:MAG: hypothetical protein ACD_75C00920G0002, partial [uncultured bacterium]
MAGQSSRAAAITAKLSRSWRLHGVCVMPMMDVIFPAASVRAGEAPCNSSTVRSTVLRKSGLHDSHAAGAQALVAGWPICAP